MVLIVVCDGARARVLLFVGAVGQSDSFIIAVIFAVRSLAFTTGGYRHRRRRKSRLRSLVRVK